MLRSLLKKIRGINPIYFCLFLFYLILNRMDTLVCGSLGDNLPFLWSWWTLMTLMVLIVSSLLYTSCPNRRGVWFSFLNTALYIGGFLDCLYILSIPFPMMWLDPGFIHFWNIFYIFLGYPWTIKEQVLWWIGWLIGITLVYLYIKKKYEIW